MSDGGPDSLAPTAGKPTIVVRFDDGRVLAIDMVASTFPADKSQSARQIMARAIDPMMLQLLAAAGYAP